MFVILNSLRVLLSNQNNILKDVARISFDFYILLPGWNRSMFGWFKLSGLLVPAVKSDV